MVPQLTVPSSQGSERRRNRTVPGGARPLELVDRDRVLQGDADVVEAVEQAVLDVVLDRELEDAGGAGNRLVVDVDPRLARLGDRSAVLLVEDRRQQPDLGAVGVEDVGEGGRDDRLEAEVLQRPGGVLAGGTAAEVGSGDEDRVRLQLDFAVADPVVEEELAEAGSLDPLEELLGDDLVGVDVAAVQDRHLAFDLVNRPHAQLQSLMSTKWPSTAAAAAIFGLTRWVRPPLPWRPSKLRLEVEAQRSPSLSVSGFIPRHIEQPATRQSKPALLKTSSRPSSSAAFFTCWEPGTTIALTPLATLRPSTIAAASRRSSIRELVQDPMKTRSGATSVIGVPACRPM